MVVLVEAIRKIVPQFRVPLKCQLFKGKRKPPFRLRKKGWAGLRASTEKSVPRQYTPAQAIRYLLPCLIFYLPSHYFAKKGPHIKNKIPQHQKQHHCADHHARHGSRERIIQNIHRAGDRVAHQLISHTPNIIGTALSPKHPTKPNITAANMPGIDRGKVILKKLLTGLTPSSQLASTSCGSIVISDSHKGKIIKGIYDVIRPRKTAKSL